jgi:hypothetical protein
MKKLVSKLAACAIALTLAALAPAEAAAKVGMSVSPKVWFSVENFNAFENAVLRNTATNRDITVREQVNIPLAGAAVSFRPGDAPFDFLFNFYGGSGKGDFVALSHGSANQVNGRYELKRTDVEMLMRFLPKDKPWNLFTGLRVNAFKDTQTLTSAHTWNATGTKTLITDTSILLWEVGAGFQAPIDEAGMHRFFGNTTFGIGRFRSEIDNATTGNENLKTGGAAGWDVNTGYEIFLGEYFSLSARYRLYAKPTSPMDDGYNLTVIHGPDFGATVRF